MVKLLSQYSEAEIIAFIVAFALAVRGLITFMDWALERGRKFFSKESEEKEKEHELRELIKSNSEAIQDNVKQLETVGKQLEGITENISLLIESDKESIKTYITKEHHYFCYQKGWIDHHSLECIEKRYDYYVKENGNSFVSHLMDDLRELPMQPPTNEVTIGR